VFRKMTSNSRRNTRHQPEGPQHGPDGHPAVTRKMLLVERPALASEPRRAIQ